MPVVTADLHSALPAILAGGARRPGPSPRCVRDDRRRRCPRGSHRHVDGLSGVLAGVVTTGKASGDPGGGQLPQWTPLGLYELRADVRRGAWTGEPGHRYPHGGFLLNAAGESVNAAPHSAGARRFACASRNLRLPAPGTRGVSHHS